ARVEWAVMRPPRGRPALSPSRGAPDVPRLGARTLLLEPCARGCPARRPPLLSRKKQSEPRARYRREYPPPDRRKETPFPWRGELRTCCPVHPTPPQCCPGLDSGCFRLCRRRL